MVLGRSLVTCRLAIHSGTPDLVVATNKKLDRVYKRIIVNPNPTIGKSRAVGVGVIPHSTYQDSKLVNESGCVDSIGFVELGNDL